MKNHSDELIFHSQGLRRSAANLVGSHRRIRLREILLACLRAKRFDMEVKYEEKMVVVINGRDSGTQYCMRQYRGR